MNFQKLIDNRYTVKKFDPEYKLNTQQIQQIKDLLQSAPSSINIQPWKFKIAVSDEAIEKVTKSTEKYGFNHEKIRDASALVVFSVADITDEFLTQLIEQEARDGRYPQVDYKTATDNGRRAYHKSTVENNTEKLWLESQVNLNAGHFVMGTTALGLDTVIMGGFDPEVLSSELQLEAERPILIIGVGIGAVDDYNRNLKKSRLSQEQMIEVI